MEGHLAQPAGQGRVSHEIKIRTLSCQVLKASKDSNCTALRGSLCWWFVYRHSGGVLPVPSGNLPCFSLSIISTSCCPPEQRAWQHLLHVAEEKGEGCCQVPHGCLCPHCGCSSSPMRWGPQAEHGIQIWSHKCGWRWVITFLGLLALLQGGCWSSCYQGPRFSALPLK